MKKVLNGLLACSLITAFYIADADALPVNSGGIGPAIQADPLVQEARLYCYNRYTGRFLHWGPCGGRRYYYRRPGRTYCYNRYTGRFLHWGACY